MGKIREGSIGTHSDNKDPDGLDVHEPGAKLDAGKPRMTLVLQNFRRALALVGHIGTYGANKYSDNGWTFVNNGVERYSDALFRHLLEEEYALHPDPESKLPHAAHAAWNALARLELMLRQELEADSEVWEAPHDVKKFREMNERSEMHEDTLLATTKKQRTAKALRNMVNATGVVLDDEHEAMLSNCEASTVDKLTDDAIKVIVAQAKFEAIADYEALELRSPTAGPSIKIHMRPLSIAETEELGATLKAKGMRTTPEQEAKRAERLRLRKLIAPMKPELMERIQLGEGLPESMKGRRFTEEELSDLAELKINEMVNNQLDRPRFDDTVMPEFEEVKPWTEEEVRLHKKQQKPIEENARFFQEAMEATDALIEMVSDRMEQAAIEEQARVSTTAPVYIDKDLKEEEIRARAAELENQRRAAELELEAALQRQRDVQDLISEHNQAAIADQKELPPLDLRALSPDELDRALEEMLETKRAQGFVLTSWDLKTEALLKERKEAVAEDLEAREEIGDKDDDV